MDNTITKKYTHKKMKELLHIQSGPVLCETLAKCDVLYPRRHFGIQRVQKFASADEVDLYPPLLGARPKGRIDSVILCAPSGAQKNCNTFSIGIELKASEEDLLQSTDQIKKYMGFSDYLFLGVPSALVTTACELLSGSGIDCGVFDIDTGQVHRSAIRQHLTCQKDSRLMHTALIKGMEGHTFFDDGGKVMYGTRGFGALLRLQANKDYMDKIKEIVAERDRLLMLLPFKERQPQYLELSRTVFDAYGGQQLLDKYANAHINNMRPMFGPIPTE